MQGDQAEKHSGPGPSPTDLKSLLWFSSCSAWGSCVTECMGKPFGEKLKRVEIVLFSGGYSFTFCLVGDIRV